MVQRSLRAVLLLSLLGVPVAHAQERPAASAPEPSTNPHAASAAAPPVPVPVWMQPGRVLGRMTAADLGLVINTADPYSVAVGEYYARRRGIPEARIARVTLPVRASLSAAEFEAFNAQLQAQLGAEVQGLALAWSQPYAVECNSITGALALGFQPELCKRSCDVSRASPYFNYMGWNPLRDLNMRLSMLLAARSVESAQALIDRGIAADHSQPNGLGAQAFYVSTPDRARNVRSLLFPPASSLRPWNLEVRRESSTAPPAFERTLLYQTGLVRVEGLESIGWLPGALADHLTSFGGQLDRPPGVGQMSAIDWIEAGATASYGTVSEPCNHLQKFPHPQGLLLYYLQGTTALEAYWRSVAWPGQGVFIGEPLAAPFSRR